MFVPCLMHNVYVGGEGDLFNAMKVCKLYSWHEPTHFAEMWRELTEPINLQTKGKELIGGLNSSWTVLMDPSFT